MKGKGLFSWIVPMTVGWIAALIYVGVFGGGSQCEGEDISDYDNVYMKEGFSFRSGNSLPVEEGKVLVELKIFDSGEGYIVVGDKRGKLAYFNVRFGVRVNDYSIGGCEEGYRLWYREPGAYSFSWKDGKTVSEPIFDLQLFEPQPEEKDITKEFLGE